MFSTPEDDEEYNCPTEIAYIYRTIVHLLEELENANPITPDILTAINKLREARMYLQEEC